jgi:hypothetical protein
VVREETAHKAGIGYQQTGKVLALRCLPDPLDRDRQGLGVVDEVDEPGNIGETAECIETAMNLALYDALVFSRCRDGEFNRPICPPTLLRVQAPVPGAPVPRAIQEAARVWGIQVEEMEEVERVLEGESESGSEREFERWEEELTGRVLDPVHYMRILDRGLARTYGYAPFLAKQQVIHHQGWLWSMRPDHDPLLNYMGLGELLPSDPAVVGEDGSIEWPGGGHGQGWHYHYHYRDYEEDVLRYFAHTPVTIKYSPLNEAVILVYWRGSILCSAVAEELRHQDGSVRSYWFPYPRLGE